MIWPYAYQFLHPFIDLIGVIFIGLFAFPVFIVVRFGGLGEVVGYNANQSFYITLIITGDTHGNIT